METFYIIVLSIATTLLILILTYFGIILRNKSKTTAAYPPKPPNTCPDYWAIAADGKSCSLPDPKNPGSKNVGSTYGPDNTTVNLNKTNTPGYGLTGYLSTPSVNFADQGWTAGGKASACTQKSWANSYGVMWDGVSNYNGCG
jgi:hypothetical protein